MKSDGSRDFVIDTDLVLNELNKIPLGQIDLIATDFRLSDETIDGLEIVKFLKQKGWRGKTPYVIYSSDSNKIKEQLQEKIRQRLDDKDKLNTFLENYFDTHPNQTFARKEDKDGKEVSYVMHIYEFLRRNKTSLNNKLSQKLNTTPDYIFKNIFPGFEGKNLGYLSKLVLDKTEESDRFEDEFIDRSVDHFIYLKE